ncbi:diheme cytochrome c [Rhodobacter viridis]|uniref:Diheme cytochrome c n=1 Tax=Rhodobacter viridis TaxID=1054202 RepID=A0A318TSS5_9RHOB|nr:diheme cytochrome c [Rhodobacter viridis]PYF07403.1 diheme cytochrome c [Rhodobacter viridis]
MIRPASLILCLALAATPVFAESEEEEEGEGGFRTAVAANPTFQTECGSCHIAYPAGFLPARSWTAIMAGLDDHFGENATLDDKTRTEIEGYLTQNAADVQSGWGRRDPAPGATPLRISELSWFVREHGREVSNQMKTKAKSMSNCAACHQGAAQGAFEGD